MNTTLIQENIIEDFEILEDDFEMTLKLSYGALRNSMNTKKKIKLMKILSKAVSLRYGFLTI